MDGEEWFKCYSENFPSRNKAEQPDLTFPQVELSSLKEAGKAESDVPVLLQRVYRDKRPVIESSVANIPCVKLGVDELLKMLNSTLRTNESYTGTPDHIPSTSESPVNQFPHHFEPPVSAPLYSLLEDCIMKGYDFGTAYAYLRPYWHSGMNAKAVAEELHTREALDCKMRDDVLIGNKIINLQVPPRRVWDLYSNRVVPWWVARRRPQPISHAWMKDGARKDVWTFINGCQWPVPIPTDANLDLIRIEMLNMGAEYAWLDVLCLRQKGAWWEEFLRKKDWNVDLPTIGNVYHGVRVMCYLNGLGRPLKFKEGDDRDRWFKRAWTLQEAGINSIIGGDVGDDGDMGTGDDGNLQNNRKIRNQPSNLGEMPRTHVLEKLDGAAMFKFGMISNMQKHEWTKLADEVTGLAVRLSDLGEMSRTHVLMELNTAMFQVLQYMQKRESTKLVDKVTGLAYLLCSSEIPSYNEEQAVEEAWTALVNAMWLGNRAQLFFRYPEPGNSGQSWRPSWNQVMDREKPLPSPDKGWWDEHVYRDEKMDADVYYGPSIDSAFVQGLDKSLKQNSEKRWGTLVVGGVEFQIVADHQYPILERSYTLLGCKPPFPGEDMKQYWVAGQQLPDLRFQKLSVFRIPDMKEAKRLNFLATKTQKYLA